MTESVVETRRRLLRYLATSPLALQLAAVLRADDAITSVKDALNVFDFEEAARRALPPAHWGYLATGVNDDRTVRANREAFDRVQIRARHLVNVSRVDTGTEVFGQTARRADLPVPGLEHARLPSRGRAGGGAGRARRSARSWACPRWPRRESRT